MWQIRFISLHEGAEDTMSDIRFHIRDHSGNITEADAKRLARLVERAVNSGWELQGFCTHPFGAWVRRQLHASRPLAISGAKASSAS
jgi:hypothetical protein